MIHWSRGNGSKNVQYISFRYFVSIIFILLDHLLSIFISIGEGCLHHITGKIYLPGRNLEAKTDREGKRYKIMEIPFLFWNYMKHFCCFLIDRSPMRSLS